jgi:hypothetical protein
MDVPGGYVCAAVIHGDTPSVPLSMFNKQRNSPFKNSIPVPFIHLMVMGEAAYSYDKH